MLVVYNKPTLCTVISFILTRSYMFRHMCAILREPLISLLVTSNSHVAYHMMWIVQSVCRLLCCETQQTAHIIRYTTWLFEVTSKEMKGSLKMAHMCRNM